MKYPGPDKLLGGHVAAWVEITFRRTSRSLWRPLRLITGAARVETYDAVIIGHSQFERLITGAARVETAVGSRPAVRRAVPLPNGKARIEIT